MANKNEGKIYLGGSIHFSGPDALERLAAGETIALMENGREFCLKVDNKSPKDSLVKVTPWIDLAEADVEISTDAKDDDPIDGLFSFSFKGPEGREVEFSISINQARIIAAHLNSYVQAHDLWQGLKETRVAPGIHQEE